MGSPNTPLQLTVRGPLTNLVVLSKGWPRIFMITNQPMHFLLEPGHVFSNCMAVAPEQLLHTAVLDYHSCQTAVIVPAATVLLLFGPVTVLPVLFPGVVRATCACVR